MTKKEFKSKNLNWSCVFCANDYDFKYAVTVYLYFHNLTVNKTRRRKVHFEMHRTFDKAQEQICKYRRWIRGFADEDRKKEN